MANIPALSDEQTSAEAKEILDEIERGMGRKPNLFRTYAHHPPLLRANWHKLKATMMEGALSRKLKEVIALLVSQDNGCDYCIRAHSMALQSLGVDETTIKTIRDGELQEAGFEDREAALVALMRKVNRAPHDVSASEFDELRSAGYSDAEIVEAYGVMETFVAFNKFLDSIGVEIG